MGQRKFNHANDHDIKKRSKFEKFNTSDSFHVFNMNSLQDHCCVYDVFPASLVRSSHLFPPHLFFHQSGHFLCNIN